EAGVIIGITENEHEILSALCQHFEPCRDKGRTVPPAPISLRNGERRERGDAQISGLHAHPGERDIADYAFHDGHEFENEVAVMTQGADEGCFLRAREGSLQKLADRSVITEESS